MKVKELIECLKFDESTGLAIDPNAEVEILVGWNTQEYILSVYATGDRLCIDIGDE